MEKIVCENCRTKFTNIGNLNRHMNNCKKGSKRTKQNNHKCQYCKNSFTRKDALKRHIDMNRCIKYKNQKNKINGNNNNAINGKDIVTIVGNNNIALNKGNININLVVFAKDGIERISPKEYKNIFGSKDNLVQALIETINLIFFIFYLINKLFFKLTINETAINSVIHWLNRRNIIQHTKRSEMRYSR